MGIGYKISRLAGRRKWIAGALLASGAIYLSLSTPAYVKPEEKPIATGPKGDKACDAALLEQQASIATRFIAAGRHDKAIILLGSCAENLKAGAPGNVLLLKATNELIKKEADEYDAKLKKWKTEGVIIGMTAERVLLSSWGKPKSVRKTVTRYGTSEQWDYGYATYLYFDNGILTSIQQ